MGKTETVRKNDWNAKRYKRLPINVKAEEVEGLKAYAEQQKKSINRLFLESFIKCHPGILSLLDDTSKQKKTGGAEE